MKKLGLSLGLLAGVALAGDTIPLKYKTTPSQNAEPQESTLLKGQAPKPKGPSANPNNPYIASIETFGSARINEVILKETLGEEFNQWIEKGLKSDRTAMELEKRMTEKLQKKFGFELCRFSVVQYFQPGDLAIHITLDVVEKKDAAKRMPFAAAPTGQFKDPDNLIKTWLEYEEQAIRLVESRELDPDSQECPTALHCPFGHKHAKLKKYEAIFTEGVKKNLKPLLEIIGGDKRPEFRSSSAYLLAYEKDAQKTIPAYVARIKDPEELVRNNAMRVLGDIAERNPQFLIPVKPVLDALNYPRVSDRSKAVYVVYQMANHSETVREAILKNSVPQLIRMMESTQPDHKELSHSILRRVSGKEFAANDIRSWNAWYAKLPGNERAIGKK